MLGRVYSNHYHKRCNHDGQGNEGNNHDRATTGWELPLYYILLRLEVTLVSEKQYQNTDAQERGAERFAHVS
jgi:hypothetical protein